MPRRSRSQRYDDLWEGANTLLKRANQLPVSRERNRIMRDLNAMRETADLCSFALDTLNNLKPRIVVGATVQ